MRRQEILKLIFLLFWPGAVMAHALVERTIPASGAVLGQSPGNVTIYFDAELEPFFSKIIVKDGKGAKVNLGDGELASDNRRALVTKLSLIGKGAYHVYWNVVSHDGHRAKGDFRFTVK